MRIPMQAQPTFTFIAETSGDGQAWASGTLSVPMTLTADCTAAQLAAEAIKHATELVFDDVDSDGHVRVLVWAGTERGSEAEAAAVTTRHRRTTTPALALALAS
jgi:hypothetical protein